MSKLKQYPATFWVACLIEVFERMAYYGFFALSSLYITGKVTDGCLGFSSEDRGFIQGVGTFVLYLLPPFMGALVERFGYKKILASAFVIMAPSYYFLGQVTSFWAFFGVFLIVAFGAAMFKPAITGTIARTTTEKTSSFGWGIFYMVVNIGGFVGPLVAGVLRGWDWNWIFGASAVWIILNLIILGIFYREPATAESNTTQKKTFKGVLNGMVEVIGNGRLFLTVFASIFLLMAMNKGWVSGTNTIIAIIVWLVFNFLVDIPLRKTKALDRSGSWIAQPMRLGHWQFGLFLVLLSGFWVVYNQVFMTLPEYIRDFCDTGPILVFLGKVFGLVGLTGLAAKMTALIDSGYQINPEFILNINPLSIMVLQLFVTWAFLKRKPFFTMMVGIVFGGIGMLLLGIGALKVATGMATLTEIAPELLANGWIAVLGVVIFSLGEMLTSPKSQEYIALIAPKDKVAIFMGYYFVSVALGNLFGGLLSGWSYGYIAKELGRPDVMWMFFAIFSIVILIAFLLYNKFVVKNKKDDLPTHDAHIVHAEDGENVPEIPEME